MNTIIRFISMLIFIALYSCKGEKMNGATKLIDVDPKQEAIDCDINIESVIPLETTDKCLIGRVTSVKFNNNEIYVFDQDISKSLFVFDSLGNFINRTTVGKGPGEVIEPWSFCFNKRNNAVLFWDQMNFNINVYDAYLRFQNVMKADKLAIRDFSILDDGNYLIQSKFFPIKYGEILEKKSYDFFIYNRNFSVPIKKIKPTDRRIETEVITNCFSGQMYYMAPLDNCIYRLSKSYESELLYTIYFGKYGVTENDLDDGTYRKKMKQGKRAFSSGNLYMNTKYVSASYEYKDRSDFFIFDRQKREVVYHSNQNDNFLKLPKCKICDIQDDNTFVAVVAAVDYNEFVNEHNLKYKSLDVENNAVLIYFTIK